MFDLKALLNRLAAGETFSREEARDLFTFMVSGEASGPQIGALLMGLRMRGETIEEIVGAVQAMRAKMLRVRAPAGAVDIVGTGGDGVGSYNISTAAAFIVAGAGVPVAKHGNRAVSSQTGAADVLTELGVLLEQTPEGVAHCLAEARMGFMFAPAHHPALRNVMPARIDLAMRTIFNILGPLLNPAGVTRHLVGVYSRDLLEPMAQAFRALGSSRALVVHGEDGMDEITTTGTTHIAMLTDGEVVMFDLTPEKLGIERAPLDALKGGNSRTNAAALRAVLAGEPGAYRDIALLNAAGGLIAAGITSDWHEALDRSRASVDGGHAARVLRSVVTASRATCEERQREYEELQ
ncbi:anthranilate phosphoribosyltransferase [Roseibium marinum]|uniref:Anthranilate phosphoribosyltransferase n=1 Tax=Roseibium marinum TaxID=281252 RepID=A0A2S3V107_9HYPH|nr:anthranilate phosphoribosyltransferase [Roseibium marinum]POF33638.1 anthranilate phosphoribosyltransferase [Roseibium marinum]